MCDGAAGRIEYEIVYEPGKDKRNLSRHTLPETRPDHIEKKRHAIVPEDIARATKCDLQLQKIIRCMRLHIWEHHKREQIITPFYP